MNNNSTRSKFMADLVNMVDFNVECIWDQVNGETAYGDPTYQVNDSETQQIKEHLIAILDLTHHATIKPVKPHLVLVKS